MISWRGLASQRLRNFVNLASSGILLQAIGFLSGPILAHALGAEGRGELSSVLAVCATVVSITSFGVGQALSRRSAVGGPVRSTLLIAVVCLFPLQAGAIALLITTRLPPVLWLLILAAILGNTLHSFTLAVLLGRAAIRILSVLRLLPFLVNLACLIALVTADRLTVEAALVSQMASLLLAGMVSGVVLIRSFRIDGPEGSNPRVLWKVALPPTLAGIGVTAFAGLDQVTLSLIATARDLGLYAVAFSYASLLEVIVSSVWSIYFKDMARAIEDEGSTRRVVRLTLALSAAGAVVMGLASPFVIPAMFGDDFTGSVTVAAILLVGRIFHDLYAVQGVRLLLSDRRLALANVGVSSFTAVAALTWLGYENFGLHGAAGGVMLAEAGRWALAALWLKSTRYRASHRRN